MKNRISNFIAAAKQSSGTALVSNGAKGLTDKNRLKLKSQLDTQGYELKFGEDDAIVRNHCIGFTMGDRKTMTAYVMGQVCWSLFDKLPDVVLLRLACARMIAENTPMDVMLSMDTDDLVYLAKETAEMGVS